MKIIKYLFLIAVVAMSVGSFTNNAKAVDVDCKSVTYPAGGTPAVYVPDNCGTATNPVTHPGCPAYAAIAEKYNCSPTSATGFLGLLDKVFSTVFIFLVTAASFFLLYAAFIYVTSEGEQEKVDQAKKIIMYAVVALIVAALAFGAPKVIQNFIV